MGFQYLEITNAANKGQKFKFKNKLGDNTFSPRFEGTVWAGGPSPGGSFYACCGMMKSTVVALTDSATTITPIFAPEFAIEGEGSYVIITEFEMVLVGDPYDV